MGRFSCLKSRVGRVGCGLGVFYLLASMIKVSPIGIRKAARARKGEDHGEDELNKFYIAVQISILTKNIG